MSLSDLDPKVVADYLVKLGSHIKLLLKFALDASEIMISFLYIQVGAAGAPRARSASAPANFLDFLLVLVRKTQTLSASCSPAATF